MIKLFRNIRKKLLEQGKTANYIKYAIGEIVLVVIGILIALSINTWNENRKNSIQEATFFSDILGDLDKDEAKLDYLNGFCKKRIEILTTLLIHVRNPGDTMGIEKFGRYVEPLYYVDDATSYSTTFESAKTSGAFNNFRKKDLLKDLTQYYANFSNLESNMASVRTLIENQLEPVMSSLPISYINAKTGSLVIQEQDTKAFYQKVGSIKDNRNLIIPYESILQDPGFESYLVGDMGRTFNALAKIKIRKEKLIHIKNKIEEQD